MMRPLMGLGVVLVLSACSGAQEPAAAPPVGDNNVPAVHPGVPEEAATAPVPSAAQQRPMDEVPVQKTLANGDREYAFANGCVVVLEATRAVVKSEGTDCQPHHRDIALLYASAD